MEKIATAEEFYQRAMDDKTIGDDITDLMNAYAKMHVEAALKVASEKIEVPYIMMVNSYPLTNIK